MWKTYVSDYFPKFGMNQEWVTHCKRALCWAATQLRPFRSGTPRERVWHAGSLCSLPPHSLSAEQCQGASSRKAPQPARLTLAFLSCPLPFQLLSHYRFHSISMLKPPPRLLIKMWNKIKPNPQSLSYDCSKPGSLNIICQQWITPALGPKLIGSQGEGCKAFGCTICSREGTPFKVWPIKSL